MKATVTAWTQILARAAADISHPVNLMEVCGSHSMAVARSGLRALLPPNVKLLSGPGCPVCVSSASFIDQAIQLSRRGVKTAVFGDLLKIPGKLGKLRDESGLLVIYSPEEALDFARGNPRTETVLAAVGFEPTAAVGAAVLDAAVQENLANFSILSDFKHLRPVLDELASDPKTALNGFLLPGHVGSIIGATGYEGLSLPGVIAGFDPQNILHSLKLLLEMIARGECSVINNYPQLVADHGNRTALNMIGRYFTAADGEWRGLGSVPGGCWRIRPEYAAFDAARKYSLESETGDSAPAGCRCGDILRGYLAPEQCPLFDTVCTPEHPVGSCMVSNEGACAAAYHYRQVAI
jgi:hydrogenase expression/formation protein HypD